jgi:hypothetical protein
MKPTRTPSVRCNRIEILCVNLTCLFLCALFLAPAGHAQTVFLDFNTPGQYTGNFNPWNDNGGADGGNYAFQEGATAGVNGSGGVSVYQSTDTTATYTSGSWDFSTNGATLLLSVLVKANGMSSGDKLQFGILNVNNNGLNGNSGVAFESYRFIPSSSTTWSLREQYRTNNTTAPEVVLGNVTVTPGRWHKLLIGLTNTSGASGNFNAGCVLFDYGADGLTPGANVVTFSTAQTHAAQPSVTLSSVWAGLRAFQDAGLDAWDNFLVYTPDSRPVMTLLMTNTTAPAGQTPTFKVLADGPGAITYSWYTNGSLVSGAASSSYTTPPLNLSYTNIKAVAANANGSVTNSATITVFVPALAALTNSPATSIQPTAATLGGQVLSTGGDAPSVTLYYGPLNGGSTPAAWSNSVALGVQSAAYSQTVSGLAPGTTYFFTASGVNLAGTSWSSPSLSFATPTVNVPAVTNFPASNVQATYATLNGQVISTGGDTPSVTVFFGMGDGGTNAGAWDQSIDIGPQSGAFAQTVTGLVPDTNYFFTARASNAAGTTWAKPPAGLTTARTNGNNSATAVLTQHNDNGRTGMNLTETVLNRNNVNTNQFGLVYTRPVDDQIYAQPLIMTNVILTGRGTHNLLIVATVNDTLYAYDADDPTVTNAYWTRSFINPPNVVAPLNTDMTGACGGAYHDFSGKMGIVGAPVIDPSSGTLYLVARTKEFGSTYVQRLHALDITTGNEQPNSPLIIAATNGVPFDPYKQNQRAGLLLVNGYVYITWSSHCDWSPYHGWVIGYNTANLLLPPVTFNATPSGSQAGVWMSNQGLAADDTGNIYLSTGNGTFDGVSNFAESFLRLSNSRGTLALTSWFTPYNWNSLNGSDADLGSGGILVIPGAPLIFSGGKVNSSGQTWLYLVNKDVMGGLSGSSTADTNAVQTWSIGGHTIHGGAVWWDAPDGSYAYIWGATGDRLRQYKFDRLAGKFVSTNTYSQGVTVGGTGQPGGILSLSANGSSIGSGIVWAAVNTTANANQSVVAGTLHAYDAQNIATELWNSDMLIARDGLGNFAKFVAPTIANGSVYMATFSNRLNVYGLFPLPPLTIRYLGANVQLSWPTNYAAGYVLQASPSVSPTVWANVGGTPVLVNGNYQVTLPVTNSTKFYRLQK